MGYTFERNKKEGHLEGEEVMCQKLQANNEILQEKIDRNK